MRRDLLAIVIRTLRGGPMQSFSEPDIFDTADEIVDVLLDGKKCITGRATGEILFDYDGEELTIFEKPNNGGEWKFKDSYPVG